MIYALLGLPPPPSSTSQPSRLVLVLLFRVPNQHNSTRRVALRRVLISIVHAQTPATSMWAVPTFLRMWIGGWTRERGSAGGGGGVFTADLSGFSVGTHPELSLGSFDDELNQKTPAKLRVPSSSSATSAQSSLLVATPSPPTFSRRTTIADKPSYFEPTTTADDDATDYAVGTPVATRPKRTARASATGAKGALTLPDQEKVLRT